MKSSTRAGLWLRSMVAALILAFAGQGGAGARPALAGAEAPTVTWWDMVPLAIRADMPHDQTVQLTFQLAGAPTTVQLALDNGTVLTLANAGGGRYPVTLTAAEVLHGYRTSASYNAHGHNHFGYLDLYQGATRVARYNMYMNVIDEETPAVAVTSLASDAQRSPRVVNVLMPAMDPATPDPAQVAKRFYQLFPDRYDFLNVIYVPQRFANRDHIVVRNSVQGIGLGPVNAGASYGSSSRLQGVTEFPLLSYFDMAETAAVHELGHQWIRYLDGPAVLTSPGAHWPLSSLAQSPMGVNGTAASGYQGLDFPYQLTPLGGGNYRVTVAGRYRAFSDMDLYLMGLLPASAVGTHFVFNNQDQKPVDGGTLYGPVTTVTVNDVIAANGARQPAYPGAPSHFRVATIVMSKGRLLSANEMAFVDHMAARGALGVPVSFTAGLSAGTTYPFHVATRGLGSLSTTLDYQEGCYAVFAPLARR